MGAVTTDRLIRYVTAIHQSFALQSHDTCRRPVEKPAPSIVCTVTSTTRSPPPMVWRPPRNGARARAGVQDAARLHREERAAGGRGAGGRHAGSEGTGPGCRGEEGGNGRPHGARGPPAICWAASVRWGRRSACAPLSTAPHRRSRASTSAPAVAGWKWSWRRQCWPSTRAQRSPPSVAADGASGLSGGDALQQRHCLARTHHARRRQRRGAPASVACGSAPCATSHSMIAV